MSEETDVWLLHHLLLVSFIQVFQNITFTLYKLHHCLQLHAYWQTRSKWASLIYEGSLFTVIGPWIHWLEQLFIIGCCAFKCVFNMYEPDRSSKGGRHIILCYWLALTLILQTSLLITVYSSVSVNWLVLKGIVLILKESQELSPFVIDVGPKNN